MSGICENFHNVAVPSLFLSFSPERGDRLPAAFHKISIQNYQKLFQKNQRLHKKTSKEKISLSGFVNKSSHLSINHQQFVNPCFSGCFRRASYIFSEDKYLDYI